MKERIARLSQLLKTAPKNKLLAFAGLIIIALALPLMVFVSQQQQNLKQNAAAPALSSATITCSTGKKCPVELCASSPANTYFGGGVSCTSSFRNPTSGDITQYPNHVTTGGADCYYISKVANSTKCINSTPVPAQTCTSHGGTCFLEGASPENYKLASQYTCSQSNQRCYTPPTSTPAPAATCTSHGGTCFLQGAAPENYKLASQYTCSQSSQRCYTPPAATPTPLPTKTCSSLGGTCESSGTCGGLSGGSFIQGATGCTGGTVCCKARECIPGEERCNGGKPQTCVSSGASIGTWGALGSCDTANGYVCTRVADKAVGIADVSCISKTCSAAGGTCFTQGAEPDNYTLFSSATCTQSSQRCYKPPTSTACDIRCAETLLHQSRCSSTSSNATVQTCSAGATADCFQWKNVATCTTGCQVSGTTAACNVPVGHTIGNTCSKLGEQFCSGTSGFIECKGTPLKWTSPISCSTSATSSTCHDNGVVSGRNDVSCICPSGMVLNSAQTACVAAPTAKPTAKPTPAATAVPLPTAKPGAKGCLLSGVNVAVGVKFCSGASYNGQSCTANNKWGVCQSDGTWNYTTCGTGQLCKYSSATVAACSNTCVGTVTKYGCNSSGQCVESSSGGFTEAKCGGTCTQTETKYACNNTGQCIVDSSGTFSEFSCGGTCSQTPAGTPPGGTPGGTPGSTAKPTPTSAPGGDTKLALNLGLDGIGTAGDHQNPGGGNPNPKTTTRPVTVQVYDLNNNLVDTQNNSSDTITYNSSTGRFTGTVSLKSGFASGSYTVMVKSPRYLRRSLQVVTITAGTTNTMPQANLTAGDIVTDNAINILDYNVFQSCSIFSKNSGACNQNADYEKYADLNDNGDIDQDDYTLLLREWVVQNGD